MVWVSAGMLGSTVRLDAAEYFVAPWGSDSNPGTSNAPFATPHKAVAAALAPGDTIWVRGGVYALNSRIAPGSSKVGAPGNPIKLWAWPGETPIFDFATMPESSDKALDLRRNYWHARGLTIRNAPDSGIFVGGTGNIIEGCVVHDCDNDGIILGSTTVKATNALILNCDSFRNYEKSGDGNNGDGFGAKAGCGPGNVFIGCRAWNNADDGWDFYQNNESVLISNCWSFANGSNLWNYAGTWKGNGNGFKLGGAGTTGRHTVVRSLAFDNTSKGFDHNNGVGAHTLWHNTGFRNGRWNFSFYDQPVNGNHDFRNNLSFLGLGGTNWIIATSLQISNSWQIAPATAADFVSLDFALAIAPRNPDYSLPTNGLARLAAGSQWIDRGGILPPPAAGPVFGLAPDVGAFERPAHTAPRSFAAASPEMVLGAKMLRVRAAGLTADVPLAVEATTNFFGWQEIHLHHPVQEEEEFMIPVPGEAVFFRLRQP